VIRTTALERGEHGSHTVYVLGCRCPKCKSAQSRYSWNTIAAAIAELERERDQGSAR
jgi:hypothetical protein